MGSSFKDAIKDHLQLKERNRWIEDAMPLDAYRTDDPLPGPVAVAGPASLEDASHGDVLDPDGPSGWPTAEGLGLEVPAALWSTEPAFDWGD
jgi:hypothetical protein